MTIGDRFEGLVSLVESIPELAARGVNVRDTFNRYARQIHASGDPLEVRHHLLTGAMISTSAVCFYLLTAFGVAIPAELVPTRKDV